MQLNKFDLAAFFCNGVLGGLGTSAGFVFPALGFLVVLLNLTGSALFTICVVGLVLFSIIAIAVALYFSYKAFNNTQNIIKKIQDKQEVMLDALLEYALLTQDQRASKENIPEALKKIYEILDSEDKNNSEQIKTKCKKEIFQLPMPDFELPENHSDRINSPKLYTLVNLFISYGCALGPCAGLIGAVVGLGAISAMSAIATPILIGLFVGAIVLTILTVGLTYYSENRNAERYSIIHQLEYQTAYFKQASKDILLAKCSKERELLSPYQFQRVLLPSQQNKDENFTVDDTPHVINGWCSII